jgi:hypothetical protein
MVMRKGNTVIAIAVGVMALIFFTLALVYYVIGQPMQLLKSLGEMLFGSSTTAQAATSAALKPVDCGAGTNVPQIYLPVIKQASDRYLGGDTAILIAVMNHESTFNPKAISDTGAVGIGQLTADTARRIQRTSKEFKELLIVTVPRADKSSKHSVTSAEKTTFLQTHPDSGRLQPVPSIMWMAFEIKRGLDLQGGKLRDAYAINYHTLGDDKEAVYATADKIVKTYNDIKTAGGCKALKDSPGKIGEDLRKLTGSSF